MSTRVKKRCETFGKWLEHHCGKSCLAPCTGQDYAALQAFAHLLDVYAYGDDRGRRAAVAAMAALVRGGMQEKIRPLAKKMIPHVLDCSDEERLWKRLSISSASGYAHCLNPESCNPDKGALGCVCSCGGCFAMRAEARAW